MKASELRIGNYINGGGALRKVISIDLDGCISEPIDDTKVDFSKGIEPIPLTEEWLVKFGFKSGMSLYTKDGYVFCFGEYDEYGLWHEDNEGGVINDKAIKYVHQLQNYFFALTGKELVYESN